ncbi:uncharacterized protein BX664DRAFT_314633 [Halteromyces radiatus]|uniref:uncharacterized protein n=1 Tax=Halteromyces radiatus TaxID=101107 RepID=UPI00221F28DA|nr:uncharacterized protein BX664DRAFT_314633 [Halteromyces radiatus]KAI8089426.1 hypothetical protein BX664DRAFT_314633 [Halteromyces radiatus]
MDIQGFWGNQLIKFFVVCGREGAQIEPGKSYTQAVTSPFMVTMAALSDVIVDNARSSLCIRVNELEFVLCSLTPGRLEQQPLNLTLVEGETVTFAIKGKNSIHLTGNYILDNDEDDITLENGLEASDMTLHEPSSTVNDDYQPLANVQRELDNALQLLKRSANGNIQNQRKRQKGSHDTLLSTTTPWSVEQQKEIPPAEKDISTSLEQQQGGRHVSESSRRGSQQTSIPPQDQFYSSSANQTPIPEDKSTSNNSMTNKEKGTAGNSTTTKNQPMVRKPTVISNEENTEQNEQGRSKQQSKATTASAENSPRTSISEKGHTIRHLPNGMIVEDIKIGKGAPAGPGNRVGMRYIGKLINGETFDCNVTGPLFKFILGRKQVIRGWDVGVAGMKVGGERKLTIPPKLAYGKRGIPPSIGPGATLIFEIKLLELQ